MSSGFTSEFFAGNRQKLTNIFKGTAPIVITASGMLQSSGDQTFPFRQDSNFWYLTGVDEPDAVLVLDKGKEYIILSEDHAHKAKFEGAMQPDQITDISGIKDIYANKEGWSKLSAKLKRVKNVASLAPLPSYVQYYGFYTNPARSRLVEKIKSHNSKIELLDLKKHLSIMRMTKQPEEIATIKDAIAVTKKTFAGISQKVWSGASTEIQIDNELRYKFLKNGADELAFDNVVAVGEHTAVIHNVSSKTALRNNKLLLIDVGARVSAYCSDLTRVFSIGKPNKRINEVYSQVSEALEHAISLLKPGVLLPEFEEEMSMVVGEKLRSLGLIKTIDKESVRKYFPTYTSHHLGLDTHDVYDKDTPLANDMVLAVEPGIYIPEEGIGIRIEENVLVNNSGVEILSQDLSQELLSLKIKELGKSL